MTPGKDRREEQAEYWDRNLDAGNIERGAGEIDLAREETFFLAPEGAYALTELGDVRGRRVVDLGAGLGVVTAILARRGAQVAAVDIAARRLERLRALAERHGFAESVETHVAAAEQLPFEDASVDALFTKSVLIHTDLTRAVREVRRVLRPGGRAVFLEPLAHNPFVNLYRRFWAPEAWKGITRYFDAEAVREVRDVFPLSHERRFHLFGFGAFVFQFALPQPALFRVAVEVSNVVDGTLMTLVPPLRHLAWFTVLTCRKEPEPGAGA